MAIARRVFEEIGGFDTVLGPGALGFGDETELMLRMLRAGFRVRGLPTCIAEHHFDLGRLQWEQLKSTAYRIGNTRGYLAWHHDGKRLGIVRPWATRILPRLFLLPLLLPFWREGRARWLHLLSDIAAIRRNRIECRGPRRQLGERLAL
jgi:GT2 family glycosyltransferase